MSRTGSWVWDVHRAAPVYWSPEMCRFHAIDPSNGPPTTAEYRALHRPEDWSNWMAAVQECVARRADIQLDSRLMLPDSSVKRLRISCRPIAANGTDVTEIIGSATELSGSEDEAGDLRPEEHFRQMIDLIPAPAWSSRPDGSVDFLNQSWLNYTGLSMDEAQNWGWMATFHPDDVGPLVEYWKSLLASGEPGAIEARLRRFDGEYRWCHILAKPLRDRTGAVCRWYGSNTDVEDRRRAEDALRERERELRQLVETIPALIWRRSATGELDYLNQRHIDYLGRTSEDLKSGAWLELVHPEDREAMVRRWLESVRAGMPYEDIYRIRRADGSYRWIQSAGNAFLDREGRIVHWYGMVVDIHDHKAAMNALRESERELRQLVDSVPGMIATANSQGLHDYANKRALDYTGTTVEASGGLGFIDTIHPDEQELVKNEWLRCAQSGEPMVLKHRWRRFDGVFRWFDVRVEPLLDDQGRIVRWYGLLTDIDDQRKAEEELRRSEQHLRLLVETIPALVWRSGPSGKLEYVNQRLTDYLGQSLDRIGFEVIHPEDRDQYRSKFADSLETGEAWEDTCRLRRADGQYRWFQVRVEPLRDHDRRLIHWYAVNLDIHEGKELEETLRLTRNRLASAMQIATVAELSASIAHEINQPLASIAANGQACVTWLAADPPNLPRAQLTTERIIRDANAAAEVVRRIRALFKQTAPAMVPSEINAIVVQVLRLLAEEIRYGGISIDTELTPGLPLVVVDRVQMQQCLINLLRNAIEAMERTEGQQKLLSVASRQEGAGILIQIRDTGCGVVDPAAIFDAFFTTKDSGMGMGLAICRSIVDAHGGRLWASPNDGPGTTLSLTLPLQKDGGQ